MCLPSPKVKKTTVTEKELRQQIAPKFEETLQRIGTPAGLEQKQLEQRRLGIRALGRFRTL